MVHITKAKFLRTSIYVPPLPEQRAIVAKIEQLFSELDNGIENLKAAKDQSIPRIPSIRMRSAAGFNQTGKDPSLKQASGRPSVVPDGYT
jgi:restriction endonuclease S subunit